MPGKVRIHHIITDLNTGGAEKVLYRLLAHLDRARFPTKVISLTSVGPVGEAIQELDIPVFALGMRPGYPDPFALMRLTASLRRDKPDILQTWLYHADLMGLIAARLAGGIPVVWNIRASDMDMSQYRRLSVWTVRACARLSAKPRAVIVNSQSGKKYHQQIGYHPKRWVLIPNGVDTEQFRPDPAARIEVRKELGVRSEAILIGLIARFDPMKDHTTFLRAARFLLDTKPETHFMLCGNGVSPDNPILTSLVESLGLEGHVHLLGEREDIPRLAAALDIAGLASAYGEGFPNIIVEAMACGVPCVVTDVGDAAIIVGNTGHVVPPREPQALARAWLDLIDIGPEARESLGLSARRRVEENYRLPMIVSRYQALYEELLAS